MDCVKWLRIRSDTRLLWTWQWSFGFHDDRHFFSSRITIKR
jgi:hypothetical protein